MERSTTDQSFPYIVKGGMYKVDNTYPGVHTRGCGRFGIVGERVISIPGVK